MDDMLERINKIRKAIQKKEIERATLINQKSELLEQIEALKARSITEFGTEIDSLLSMKEQNELELKNKLDEIERLVAEKK